MFIFLHKIAVFHIFVVYLQKLSKPFCRLTYITLTNFRKTYDSFSFCNSYRITHRIDDGI